MTERTQTRRPTPNSNASSTQEAQPSTRKSALHGKELAEQDRMVTPSENVQLKGAAAPSEEASPGSEDTFAKSAAAFSALRDKFEACRGGAHEGNLDVARALPISLQLKAWALAHQGRGGDFEEASTFFFENANELKSVKSAKSVLANLQAGNKALYAAVPH